MLGHKGLVRSVGIQAIDIEFDAKTVVVDLLEGHSEENLFSRVSNAACLPRGERSGWFHGSKGTGRQEFHTPLSVQPMDDVTFFNYSINDIFLLNQKEKGRVERKMAFRKSC